MSIKFSPSLACSDPFLWGETIDQLQQAGADLLHMDVMDGHYVPNLCFSLDQIGSVRRRCSLPMDLHLMVTDPFDYVEPLGRLGVEYAAFHLDSTPFPLRLAGELRRRHIKAGLALNPSQPAALAEHILPYIDYILLMSIEPGFSGQPFIEETYSKLSHLASLRQKLGLSFKIFVDGGIGREEAKRCAKAGADVLCLGMFACFGQPKSVGDAYREFVECVNTP